MPRPAKRHATQQSVNSAIKSICDVMRRAGCKGAMQYVPELTWILFLRLLDERDANDAQQAEAVGESFRPTLVAPYRWQDWAAPEGAKRRELVEGGAGKFFAFVNGELLPHLHRLEDEEDATARQRVTSEVMYAVEQVRIDTERNFLDVLDKVHALSNQAIDDRHVFALSQIYEGLLLKMGEKNNDGGQFFTPREVIRAIIEVVDPQIGESVYDPCCGTGGFLAQAYEYMREEAGDGASAEAVDTLKHRTFYGREEDKLAFPIALANLALHGIDQPHLWHGNTLTGRVIYDGLYAGAPPSFDVILTNPPFGGKEGKEAQTPFDFKTSATQVLFLQHVIRSLAPEGRCGVVLDEGVLFRTNESAFVRTKQKLLDECDLWCIVSLPGGVFTAAGAGVKTNLLFFNKGQRTERVWYYDLSDLKIRKKSPMTRAHFDEFFALLPSRGDSERSWTVEREAIVAKNYDLKAVNPHVRSTVDTRTPAELIDLIELKGREISAALAQLRAI